MNEQLLESLGLTKGESKVYYALLQIGETTTGNIIDEAQISSGKIYEILDKLIKKGLVSFIIKEKTKYFKAASPQRIFSYLNEKENELQKKKKELERELPTLLALQDRHKQAHETTLFKGLKGIRTAIDEALDALKKDAEVLAIGVTAQKNEKYNGLWESWHRKRAKRKIVCKLIFNEQRSVYARVLKKLPLTQVKYLEGIRPAAVDIMGEQVLIFTYGQEPSCLVIKDAEIAQSFTAFFETLWKIAQ